MKIEIQKYRQIADMLTTLQEVQSEIASGIITWEEICDDVNRMVLSINNALWNCDSVGADVALNEWIDIHTLFINQQLAANTDLDRRFKWLMTYVDIIDRETIILNVKKELCNYPPELLPGLQNYYQTYDYFWGSLDISNNIYDVITNRVDVLIEHRADFLWLYDRLYDYRSKNVLVLMLEHWLTFSGDMIWDMKESNFPDYYDPDIFVPTDEEVVVDLGAYDGDSAIGYIQSYGHYKRIYCYEITPSTVEKLKENMSEYPDIVVRHKAVGDKEEDLFLEDDQSMRSETTLSERGSIRVPVVSLDSDIEEQITLLKMDIEGSEQSAIRGCKNHIINDRPKILACVYHGNKDIFEVPRLIDSIRDDYKFYLRSNGRQWGPAEIVLFAI